MKIIKIKGGLGNQLFQYAYGRNLELSGEKVVFDTSFFNGAKAKIDTARNFKLYNYNIETKAKFSDKNHSLLNILDKVKRKMGFKHEEFYQSEKYFLKSVDAIRKEFTLKNPLTPKSTEWKEAIIKTENSVCLHIRRGDYVHDPKTKAFHGTCSVEYYKKAFGAVFKRVINKEIKIFVFSDDLAWAKENLFFNFPTYYVSDPQIPDYEEIYLMSLCKNNIIANSTFSWWGAWLNQNSDKIVVAPKQWFVNKTADELEILPKTWIQI